MSMNDEYVELEPCPNCETKNIVWNGYPIEEPYLYYFFCKDCGFSSASRPGFSEAAREWNRQSKELLDKDRQETIRKNVKKLRKMGVL